MAQAPPGGGRGTPLSMADMMSLQAGGQGMRPNAQAAWQQQQQQQHTVSPAGGQPGGVLNAAQLQLLQAANPGLLQNPNLQQQLALQALLMQRQQQQQQQQAGRGGGHKQAAAGLGGPGGVLQMQQALQGLQGGAGGMRRHGSGALPGPGGGGYGGGRGPGGGGPSALGRPLGSGGPLTGAGSSGAAGSAVNAKVTAALGALRGGEPPKVEPPEGHEWVQCISRTTGKPEWYAVPRARAQTMRLAQQAGSGGGGKRKADGSLTGQPPHKAAHTAGGGRGGGRGARDDVSVIENDVLEGVTDVAADMSQSGAARVVAEQGNVQEDYLLNQGPTMAAVARSAREGGVKAVSESVYPYLSLAAEAYLVQLLHSLAKMRLQREDLGRAYAGAEKLDDRLRGGLFAIQKREREAARKREEEQRDELAKLGATRKKLAEEDKKAAKAAQNARQLQQQQKNLGSTLQMMGIGRRAFAMGSLARPAAAAAAAAGSSKAGLTKPELLEAKAAAAAEDEQQPAATAAAAAALGVADNTAAAANGAPGAGPADAAAAAAAVSGGAADGGGDDEDMGEAGPLLKPMSLAHQLVSAAQPGGGAGVPGFVAGGASASRARDGEAGLREVMLADLIAALERHPLYCRSAQLYALHALAGQPGPQQQGQQGGSGGK